MRNSKDFATSLSGAIAELNATVGDLSEMMGRNKSWLATTLWWWTTDDDYWISISDLMTSLLFIFIIILAYTILTFSEKSAVFEESFYKRGELLTQIQTTLKAKNIDVDIDVKNGNMRIKSDGFFAVGAAVWAWMVQAKWRKLHGWYKPNGKEKEAFKNAIDTVFIEGHTDNAD